MGSNFNAALLQNLNRLLEDISLAKYLRAPLFKLGNLRLKTKGHNCRFCGPLLGRRKFDDGSGNGRRPRTIKRRRDQHDPCPCHLPRLISWTLKKTQWDGASSPSRTASPVELFYLPPSSIQTYRSPNNMPRQRSTDSYRKSSLEGAATPPEDSETASFQGRFRNLAANSCLALCPYVNAALSSPACRSRRKSRRQVSARFTRSSTTGSASWRAATPTTCGSIPAMATTSPTGSRS
jgi:hypothetical protein